MFADELAPWQATLFETGDPAVDEDFRGVQRVVLDGSSWVDVCPGWLHGDGAVFEELVRTLTWRQRDVTMYERRLAEPRLTSWWEASHGEEPLPVLAAARRVLAERYAKAFDSIGFNWYRDGTDSVAWHGDRHRHHVENPVVAIVSAGAPRPLRLRPRPGGPAQGDDAMTFRLGHGDLFVMGGACQHDWQHAVPKVAAAGPRLSITYRHDAARAVADVARPGTRQVRRAGGVGEGRLGKSRPSSAVSEGEPERQRGRA